MILLSGGLCTLQVLVIILGYKYIYVFLNDEIIKLIVAQKTVYVFTAAMGPGGERKYAASAKVQFPVVLTNVGGAYNATGSEFQCPVSGLYMFSVSLLSQKGNLGNAHIMVNGEMKVTTYSDGREAPRWDHSTNVVLTECQAGHKVWIQVPSMEDNRYFHDTVSNYCTFSGVLLYIL